MSEAENASAYRPALSDFRKDGGAKREYQHHRKRFPWPEQLHLKFITAIFDIGLAVANSYALDETVDNISSNPSYDCDPRAVRQFIQEINEYRQLSRLRDEKWIQLIPQRLLNDTTSELGKRLIIETQRREAEMRYLATRGPLSSKRISLCSDVIFLNPSTPRRTTSGHGFALSEHRRTDHRSFCHQGRASHDRGRLEDSHRSGRVPEVLSCD